MGRICEYCEEAFIPKRSDAIYCTHKCRQAAYVFRKNNPASENTEIEKHRIPEGICNTCPKQSSENCKCSIMNMNTINFDSYRCFTIYNEDSFKTLLKSYGEENLFPEDYYELTINLFSALTKVSFENPRVKWFYERLLGVIDTYLSFLRSKTATRKQYKKLKGILEVLIRVEFCCYLTAELRKDVQIMADHVSDLHQKTEKGVIAEFKPEKDKKALFFVYCYHLITRVEKKGLYDTI